MTITEMIYEVYETVRRNIVDDDEIDDRYIEQLIQNQRALWIEQELNKNTNVSQFIQSLDQITLEPVDSTLISVGSADPDNKILRSTIAIPLPLSYGDKFAITRVSPVNMMEVNFNFVHGARAPYTGSGKFNSRAIYSFYENEYLYLYANDNNAFEGLTSIYVEGIFEDPTEVPNFARDTDRYPIPLRLWNYLESEVLKKLGIKINSDEDKDNNSTNDYEQG